MKYLSIFPLFLLLACQNQETDPDTTTQEGNNADPVAADTLPYEFFTFTDSVLLLPGEEFSPIANYAVDVLLPRSTNEALNTLINTQLAAVIAGEDAPVSTTDLRQTLKIAARNVLYNYKKQAVDPAEVKEFPSSYMLDHDFQTRSLLNRPGLLTLATSHYSYTGGAHGYYYTVLHSFATDSTVLLNSEVVFLPGSEAALSALLTNKAEVMNLPIQTDSVPFTTNFAYTKEGILFDYPPYEIASYADGEIEIILPYAEVSHLLTGKGEMVSLLVR